MCTINLQRYIKASLFFILLYSEFGAAKSKAALEAWLLTDTSKRQLVLFYQENCPSCKRQFAHLKCLKKISDLEILLVGVGNNKLKLKRTALKYDLKFKLARVSEARKYGIIGTPSSLLFTQEWLHFQGVQSCSKISKLLKS